MKKFQQVRKTLRDGILIALSYPGRILKPNVGKRVICFHEIQAPGKFHEMLGWLNEHYEIVSLSELLERPVGGKGMVAITFDDGYHSWHETAAPILEEFKIPATFFVCSGFVGLEGEQARHFVRTCLHRKQELLPLTRFQLSELARHSLFEIGSHTVHHIDLGQPWDRSTLEREILADRKQLQDWTGEDVRWFAYPFGMQQNISEEAVTFLKKSSFSAALTFIPKFLTDYTDRFWIGRDGLDLHSSPLLWSAWLWGGYDMFYGFKEKIMRNLAG